jgi:hypothetical protein
MMPRQQEQHMSKEMSIDEKNGYGLSVVDNQELGKIEVEIRDLHTETEKTLKVAFIKFGELLCEARTLIKDDTVFGAWRVEKTPFESKENANKAMQLSRAIEDGRITDKMLKSPMGQSHLLELKDATLITQSRCEDALASGNVPTVKELRAWKKEATTNAEKVEGIRNANKPDETEKTKEPSYSNGYEGKTIEKSDDIVVHEDKDATVKSRSPKDLLLDEINEFEALITDLMDSSTKIHQLAEKAAHKGAKMQVNEWRDSMRTIQNSANALFDEIESEED